jgi:PAS domain-containing protein
MVVSQGPRANDHGTVTISDINVLIALLAVLGGCLGLVTGWIVKNSDAHPVPDPDDFAKLAISNSTDLVWIEFQGAPIWQNKTCQDQMAVLKHGAPDLEMFGLSAASAKSGGGRRGQLTFDGEERFFDIEVKAEGDLTIIHAKDASAALGAERELQRFMQTLTDTFAHIPIGLAIFDRSRFLALYNPALAELFDLEPEWLTRRPGLQAFLDHLRNDGKLPEPKDFKDWRRQIEVLERSAESGNYQEDWHLPNGRVFRVSGRPHPKNAVAFLFEDISRTVAIERAYRAELEDMFNTFDNLTSAVVIFDSNGQLAFSNQAFAEVWGEDASASLGTMGTTEMTRLWQKKCEPTPVWGDFRDFAADFGERSHWQAVVKLLDGPFLSVSFAPIPGGRILCEFAEVEAPSGNLLPQLKQMA